MADEPLDLSWIGGMRNIQSPTTVPAPASTIPDVANMDWTWLRNLDMDPAKAPAGHAVSRAGYQGTTSRNATGGGKPVVNDEYAKRLAKYQAQLEKDRTGFVAQQEQKRAEFQKALDAATAQRTKAEENIHAELLALRPVMQALQPRIHNSTQAGEQYSAFMERANLLNQGLKNLDATYTAGAQKALDDYNAGADAEYAKVIGKREKDYMAATAAAEQLRARTAKQAEFDKAYDSARGAYENAVTQHDKDYAAFKMYEAQKAMYDQDSADRTADIDAGRYAVNPYQFMAQGAGINEIDELRKQVNAGNLRPNMRVPDALVAPTEVKDPGQLVGDKPARQYADEPEISGEIGDILGYTAPKPPKEDAPLPTASTAAVDTSSVASAYDSPEEKKKKEEPEPEKDASGNPVVAGAGTLQQTSSTAGGASPTQQTATQAATPAPALPAQPTGSVAGQGSNTGQTPETQTPPKTEEKPDPFTSDEEKKEEQDSVF